MQRINVIDFLVTNEALEIEASLKSIVKRETGSPNLDNVIRETSLWKLTKSEKLGKISN